jgi:hypothetical protein
MNGSARLGWGHKMKPRIWRAEFLSTLDWLYTINSTRALVFRLGVGIYYVSLVNYEIDQ